MPLVGEFHAQYWALSDTLITGARPRGGYLVWQAAPTTVVIGVGFGGLTPWVERAWAWVTWWIGATWRVRRLDVEQRAVLTRVIGNLTRPQYRIAQCAVRGTATTLGFNRPEAWLLLGRALKASPGAAENTYRHLESCEQVSQMAREMGSTLTNPDLHLLVELAYHGFAVQGAR